MRTLIHADAEPIHQLATQPASDSTESYGYQREDEWQGAWQMIGITPAQQPTRSEEYDDNHITNAMPQADGFSTSAGRNGQPIP